MRLEDDILAKEWTDEASSSATDVEFGNGVRFEKFESVEFRSSVKSDCWKSIHNKRMESDVI